MSWAVIVFWLKGTWTWIKANTGFLLLCAIGMFTGAKLLRRKDSQISSLNEALAAEKHNTEIARLKEKAIALEKLDATSVARDKVLVEEITEVEREAAEHKKRLLALHNKQLDPNTMTDAEVEEHFRNAGL